jgi:hypothetical protein
MPSGRLAGVRGARAGGGGGGEVRLEPGPLAVWLLVDGLPVTDLAAGTRLRIGEAVTLELGPAGRGGHRPRQDAGPGAPREPGGVREVGAPAGIPARVLVAGPVRTGDSVAVDAVALPIEDVLDLHPFRPDETAQIVQGYLADARAAGLREVRIVHGRGRGVQRAIVQRVLGSDPAVAGFADAGPERGGWGATVVRLRDGPGPGSR